MGVERAVTRWYAKRHVIMDEIEALEAKLSQAQQEGQEPDRKEQAAVEAQLVAARAKLLALGPCPKPMMG
ncbi:MAG TPA: hypothetical protein VKV20_08645 [Ktedonobacteraceae bacterium]|jgi:ABC-type xylose transport system substrate-binding protein|nr:hypothetical protein [Ktedonobacteraceae bacterium]